MRNGLYLAVTLAACTAACTSVTYHQASGEMLVNSDTTGTGSPVPATYDYEMPLRTLRLTDKSGGMCAVLATIAGRHNAREAAIKKAIDNREGYFSYKYKLHTAKEFQGGFCSAYYRWGKQNVNYTRTVEGAAADDMYEGAASMTELGLEIGAYYSLFDGLTASPLFRIGGGKWKWVDPDGRDYESNVADIGVGGTLDLVPTWLFGIGIHLTLFKNFFGESINIAGGFDYTITPVDNVFVSIGMISDLRRSGYNVDDFMTESNVAGPRFLMGYHW